jgi:hypothetical protein
VTADIERAFDGELQAMLDRPLPALIGVEVRSGERGGEPPQLGRIRLEGV